MAITTVRARLGETWTALEYNPATGRWEGVLLPGRTSAHQPGGYYGVEVEAANDRGETASISGEVLAALRLVVRETQKPLLNLVSPAAGYVTVKRPGVVMDAVDEAGGSGIALDSWTVTLDGIPQSAGKTAEEIPGGYRLRWTPAADWSEGGHTVAFTVSDRDGNEAGKSAAYTVDTVPPELTLALPDSQRVVDAAEITAVGTVRDGTSGIAGVEVVGEGGSISVEPAPSGDFTCTIPLEVGVNTITVIAVDGAGNRTAQEVYMIRMVTDRTQADAERARELCARGYARWTAEERAWWNGARCRRGSYDALDLNRVTVAMEHIREWLEGYGYVTPYQAEPHRPWRDGDAMTRTQGTRYLQNVEALRKALALPEGTPETPESLEKLTVAAANDIEKILVAVDARRAVMDRSSWWPCGTITCGGVF